MAVTLLFFCSNRLLITRIRVEKIHVTFETNGIQRVYNQSNRKMSQRISITGNNDQVSKAETVLLQKVK